eukprot:gene6686-7392_t
MTDLLSSKSQDSVGSLDSLGSLGASMDMNDLVKLTGNSTLASFSHSEEAKEKARSVRQPASPPPAAAPPPLKDKGSLEGMTAAHFVWSHLWSPHSTHYHEVDLLDTILLEGGAVTGWLFTNREGEVRSKARRRWNESSVVDRLTAPNNSLCGFLSNGDHAGWKVVKDERLVRNLFASGGPRVALLAYGHLAGAPLTSLLRVDYEIVFRTSTGVRTPFAMPAAEPVSSSHSRMEAAAGAGGGDMGKPRIRCWTLCDEVAVGRSLQPAGHGKENSSEQSLEELKAVLPSHQVICRNAPLVKNAKDSILRLVKIVEAESGQRVGQLSAIYLLQDSNGAGEEAGMRLWLHHVDKVSLLQGHRGQGAVMMSASALISSAASAASSIASFAAANQSVAQLLLKPSLQCAGDFCSYLTNNEEGRAASPSHEDDLFDIKTESLRAIQRHRRLRLASSNADGEGGAAVEEEEEEQQQVYSMQPAVLRSNQQPSDNSSAASLAGGSSSLLSQEGLARLVPRKEFSVLNKSIANAREEMVAVERIETDFNSNCSVGEGKDESSRLLEMKERLAAVWPPNIARWWLAAGRFLRRVRGVRLGRVAAVTSRAPPSTNLANTAQVLRLTSSSAPAAVGRKPQTLAPLASSAAEVSAGMQSGDAQSEETKWFVFHHAASHVCEACYLVYRELDKHRNSRLRAIAKQTSAAAASSSSSREEDREIERRIFSQRRACTHLSRPKVTSNSSSSSSMLPSNSVGFKKKKVRVRDLPPLPANSSSMPSLAVEEQQPRLVQHLLRRPIKSYTADSTTSEESAALAHAWRQATEPPPQLVPVRHTRPSQAEEESKKVNVDGYTAERLLHPWQRDFQKMKKMIFGGGGGADSASSPSRGTTEGEGRDDLDPFASMIGLGSRTNSAQLDDSRAAMGSADQFSRPSTQQSRLGSAKNELFRGRSWLGSAQGSLSHTIAEEEHGEEDEHREEDEEDDEEEEALGWNPFVLNL